MSAPDALLAEARALFAEKKAEAAAAALERALSAASGEQRARVAQAAGLLAQKAGEPRLAIRWYRRAGELSPGDAEPRHDRGIAHLEAGEVGLAAQAQAEALALDPEHTGARAQRAAALQALGDDGGAARELDELLRRLGPQPAMSARLLGLRAAAGRAEQRRLLGAPQQSLIASPLLGNIFARILTSQPPEVVFRASFAELRVSLDRGGRSVRLALVFDSMEASLARTDLSYGGTTEDEHGRRVPLDEFFSAGTVFLSVAFGIEPERARRLLDFLLTPECGLGPHAFAGAQVGWLVVVNGGAGHAGDGRSPKGGASNAARRYGLLAELTLR